MAEFQTPTIDWGINTGYTVTLSNGSKLAVYNRNGVLGYWLYKGGGSYWAAEGVSQNNYTWIPVTSDMLDQRATSSGGGGGGSISSDLARREAINDVFYEYLGRAATSTEMSRALSGQWSRDHIVRYIMSLREWEGSVGWQRMAADVQRVWDELIGRGEVPITYLRTWINGLYTQDQIIEAIRKLPEYINGNEYLSLSIEFENRWQERIGLAMTEADRQAMHNAIMNGWSATQWDDYITDNPLYRSGIEYQSRLLGAVSILRDLWGDGAVDAILAANPNFVEERVWGELGQYASPIAIREWARLQPQYLEGPGAASTRENLLDTYRLIMRAEPSEEQMSEWILEGLTPQQLLDRLRDTPEYQTYFAGRPPWMSEAEYVARKEAYLATVKAFYGDDYELTEEQIRYFIEHGITPTELGERFRASEEAVANLANMNYYGAAVGRVFTMEDAMTYAMRTEGYGEIAKLIVEGQNRRAFDEVFKMYTGRLPTLEDYEYLRSNYVSPNEYSARVSAIEKAQRGFEEVDRLFMRTLGYHADYDKYLNAVMGGEGSGAYLALIDAAEELDRYNTAYKLHTGHDATPEQLRQWVGLGSVDALEKMLETQELVKQRGPELLAMWNNYFRAQGAPTLSEEDLFTVLGRYEGWGVIQRRLDAAAAHKERQDRYRLYALSTPHALAYTALTPFGGPKLPTLARPQ